jgi:hypothetical protein
MTVSGSNLDYTNPLETLNAIQRNPQLRRLVGNGTVTTNALYSVVVPTGVAVVTSTAGVEYTIAAPGMVFPFGAPTVYSPGIGPVSISSAATVTLIYHL